MPPDSTATPPTEERAAPIGLPQLGSSPTGNRSFYRTMRDQALGHFTTARLHQPDVYHELKIARAPVEEDPLTTWFLAMEKGELPFKPLHLVVGDTAGREVGRYQLQDTWPVRWHFSDSASQFIDTLVVQFSSYAVLTRDVSFDLTRSLRRNEPVTLYLGDEPAGQVTAAESQVLDESQASSFKIVQAERPRTYSGMVLRRGYAERGDIAPWQEATLQREEGYQPMHILQYDPNAGSLARYTFQRAWPAYFYATPGRFGSTRDELRQMLLIYDALVVDTAYAAHTDAMQLGVQDLLPYDELMFVQLPPLNASGRFPKQIEDFVVAIEYSTGEPLNNIIQQFNPEDERTLRELTLSRTYLGESTLKPWHDEIISGIYKARELTLSAVDASGNPLGRYTLNNAWPLRYESAPVADLDGVFKETLTFLYDNLTWTDESTLSERRDLLTDGRILFSLDGNLIGPVSGLEGVLLDDQAPYSVEVFKKEVQPTQQKILLEGGAADTSHLALWRDTALHAAPGGLREVTLIQPYRRSDTYTHITLQESWPVRWEVTDEGELAWLELAYSSLTSEEAHTADQMTDQPIAPRGGLGAATDRPPLFVLRPAVAEE